MLGRQRTTAAAHQRINQLAERKRRLPGIIPHARQHTRRLPDTASPSHGKASLAAAETNQDPAGVSNRVVNVDELPHST